MRTAIRRHRSQAAANRRRSWSEPLEPRLLLSAITEYGGLQGYSPTDLKADAAGNIWFASETGQIGEINATTRQVTQFSTPASTITALAVGADGNIWVGAPEAIYVMSPAGSVVDTFTIDPAQRPRTPVSMTSGPNGQIYFAAEGQINVDPTTGVVTSEGWVGRIDPSQVGTATHTIDYYATDTFDHWPTRIITSSDGYMYVDLQTTAVGTGPTLGQTMITRVATDGSMTNFNLGPDDTIVTDLAAAPDGSLWYTTLESGVPSFPTPGADQFAHLIFDASTGLPQITYYLIDNTPGYTTDPASVTVGTNGMVYAGEVNLNDILQLDPTTGTLTHYALPTANATPLHMTTAPDGGIWFSEYDGNQIGELVVSSGTITTLGRSLDLVANEAFSGTVASFTTTLGVVPVDQFTVSIDWGDGNVSPGTVTYDAGTNAYSVAGDHTYAANGDYAIAATITTAGAPTATADSVAHVGPVLSVTPLTFTQPENTEYSGPVATFTLRRPLSATASAVINWGDGSPAGYGAIGPDGVGGYVVLGTHTYSDIGTYGVVVTVLDGTDSAAATSTAEITPTPLVVSGNALHAILHFAIGAVASFTADVDATASQFSASINWGDGRTSGGLIIADPNQAGHFYVIGLHFYLRRGAFSTLTTITDGTTGQVSSATGAVTV